MRERKNRRKREREKGRERNMEIMGIKYATINMSHRQILSHEKVLFSNSN
jgi:hypothetical protein